MIQSMANLGCKIAGCMHSQSSDVEACQLIQYDSRVKCSQEVFYSADNMAGPGPMPAGYSSELVHAVTSNHIGMFCARFCVNHHFCRRSLIQ